MVTRGAKAPRLHRRRTSVRLTMFQERGVCSHLSVRAIPANCRSFDSPSPLRCSGAWSLRMTNQEKLLDDSGVDHLDVVDEGGGYIVGSEGGQSEADDHGVGSIGGAVGLGLQLIARGWIGERLQVR